MKVLALVTDAYGGYGGIAQYNRDFLTALARLDAVSEIFVLPRVGTDPHEPPSAKVVQHTPIKERLAYSAAAAAAAFRFKPNLIFNGHLFHSPLSARLAHVTGAKLLSQLHGVEIWPPVNNWRRTALEQSDLVLAVSQDTRHRALKRTALSEDKVVVLSNTVGDAFTPGDREAARRRFGIAAQQVVLSVSRLEHPHGTQNKGHYLIIPLIAQLRREGRDVTYFIAGAGGDRKRLERMAAKHAVLDHIRFLGRIDSAALPDLYRAADLFALPSTSEGFGIVFVEAMACGTPAIGLDVGGAADALGAGEFGHCVAPDKFANTFLAALRGPPLRDASLPIRVRRRFGFDRFVEDVADMMHSRFDMDKDLPETRSA